MSLFSKVVLIAIGVLSIIMLIVSLIARNGYVLAEMSMYTWPLAGTLLALLAWLGYGIYGRLRDGRRKKYIMIVIVTLLIMVFSVVCSIGSVFCTLVLSSKYADIRSPKGEHMVILRCYESVEAKLKERYPDVPEEELVAQTEDDFNYFYTAFPRKWFLFADLNADVEGGISISTDSAAKLMVEWQDDDTAHLYIEDAEQYDAGEITVRFAK